MKNTMWIKKGILYGLVLVFFSVLLTPVQAEASVLSALRKTALKQKLAAGQTEEKSNMNPGEELKAKQEELETLKGNAPNYLIPCQYCDGTQESNTPCNQCNGTGIMDMPGNDAVSLSMVISCMNCRGSGYERCKMCMGGEMADPDYRAKYNAWKEKIENLEEEIKQLDMQLHPEKYAAKGNDGKTGNNDGPAVVPGPDPVPPAPTPEWNLETKKSDCVRCKGSGREQCSSCQGTGYLSSIKSAPDYAGTGGGQYTVQTKCSCDNGYRTCGLCLGSGKN